MLAHPPSSIKPVLAPLPPPLSPAPPQMQMFYRLENVLLPAAAAAVHGFFDDDGGGGYAAVAPSTAAAGALMNTPFLTSMIMTSSCHLLTPPGELHLSLQDGGGGGGGKVGRYTAEERKERIERYRSKRNQRNFHKKITVTELSLFFHQETCKEAVVELRDRAASAYDCRKTLADSRPRVRGRFARNGGDAEAEENYCDPHECGGFYGGGSGDDCSILHHHQGGGGGGVDWHWREMTALVNSGSGDIVEGSKEDGGLVWAHLFDELSVNLFS